MKKHNTPNERASDREQNTVQIGQVLHRAMNTHDQVSMSQNHKSTAQTQSGTAEGIKKEREGV